MKLKVKLSLFVCLTLSGCGEPEAEETAVRVEVVPVESIGVTFQTPDQRAADERLEEIHRKWIGTAWDFSGTSQEPGKGAIACGYFVTTTLRDAGVKVDRVRLAQAASEKMILETTDKETVRRFSDKPLADVLTKIRTQGEGYYIVGLDNHTGFLRVGRDGKVTFIHSGPGKGVVFEEPEKSEKLVSSRYRVTGKIVWKVDAEAATPSP